MRGPASRRRSSSTMSEYFNEGMFADTRRRAGRRRRHGAGRVTISPRPATRAPTQGYASDFRPCPSAPARLPGRTSACAAVPPRCTPAASTTSAAMAARTSRRAVTSGTARQLRLTMQWDDPYDVTPVTLGAVILQAPGRSQRRSPDGRPHVHRRRRGQAATRSTCRGSPATWTRADRSTSSSRSFSPMARRCRRSTPEPARHFGFFATQNGHVHRPGHRVPRMTQARSRSRSTRLSASHERHHRLQSALLPDRHRRLPGLRLREQPCHQPAGRAARHADVPDHGAPTQVQMVISRANTPTAPIPASRAALQDAGLHQWHHGLSGRVLLVQHARHLRPQFGRRSQRRGGVQPVPAEHSGGLHVDRTGAHRLGSQQSAHPRCPAGAPEAQPRGDGRRQHDVLHVGHRRATSTRFSNFFGTSAAAPTAASIAALVLQAKGGPGSVTPAQMRTMLQNSAFPHDLDPYACQGRCAPRDLQGTVQITVQGDNSADGEDRPERHVGLLPVGPSSITSITFDVTNANPNGGNVSVPSTPGTRVRYARGAHRPAVRRRIGQRRALTAANVAAADAQPRRRHRRWRACSSAMRLDFTPGSFTGSKTLRFGVATRHVPLGVLAADRRFARCAIWRTSRARTCAFRRARRPSAA